MTLRILIVDDEEYCRAYIKDMINELRPGSVVFEAANADEAKNILENDKIEILFLDINLNEQTGFDLLNEVNDRTFEIVFTTAHSSYAIQAIKEGAVDYLLKPIKKTEFEETLVRIAARISAKQTAPGDDAQSFSFAREEEYLKQKIIITHQQGIKYVTLKDIVFLKADNTYTEIYLENRQKIVTSKPISKFESTLSDTWFFRIHKTYIINLYHFSEYISKGGDIALMNTGERLMISRYRVSPFLEHVQRTTAQIKL